MKRSLTFLLILSFVQCYSQGLEIVPDNQYENLNTPFILSGSSQLPEISVISPSLLPPAKDQGSQQSCVGWSLGYYYMTYYQNLKSGLKNASYDNNSVYSPSYLYQCVKACNDCSCGSRLDQALNFLMSKGNVTYDAYPFDSSKCYKLDTTSKLRTTYSKITNWYRIEDLTNLTEYKKNLAQGIPIILSLKVNKDFYAFRYKKETDVFKKSAIENYEYHAILCTGYDDKKQAMQVYNSWGEKWGNKGFAWIDYSTFLKMVKQAFYIEKPMVEKQASQATAGNRNGNRPTVSNSGGRTQTGSSNRDKVNSGAGSLDRDQSSGSPTSNPIKEPVILKPDLDGDPNNGPTGMMSDGSDAAYQDYIEPYVVSEPIKRGRNYYTMGVKVKPNILPEVKKVVYHYNLSPTYYEEEEVMEPPFFKSSYEGRNCIQDILVSVYMKDDEVYLYELNGCEFANVHQDNISLDQLEIEPTITLEEGVELGSGDIRDENDEEQIQENHYEKIAFKVDLRGIEMVKSQVQKVIYSCMDDRLGLVSSVKTSGDRNLDGSIILTDCSEKLDVTVLFNNGTKQSFNINMCEEMGWE